MVGLSSALAPLASREQFVAWFAEPKPENPAKLNKYPCDWRTGRKADAHDDGPPTATSPGQIKTSYAQAVTAAPKWNRGHGAGAGFVFTDSDPYFFLDIDGCLIKGPDGASAWSPLAMQLVERFRGAAVEISLSGKGLHIIGRYTGPLPLHSTRNQSLGLELYHAHRFVALTDRDTVGSCEHDCTVALHATIAELFQPKAPGAKSADWTTEPVAEWTGPEDDDQLIAKALASGTKSAAAVFGGSTKATFADLWNADPDKLAQFFPQADRDFAHTEADQALANHLAFWTGKNCERIDRLMRRSGLAREKWDRHGTYLEGTIKNACAFVRKVLTKPKPNDLPSARQAWGTIRFLTPDQCAASPSRGYVVKGLMAPSDVGCIFGAPGAGKSLLAPYIGYCVALGKTVFGRRTRAGKVFYIAAEDERGMAQRVTALRSAHGHTPEFITVTGVSDLFDQTSPVFELLMDRIEQDRPVLIFIDTLAMAFPGLEENTAEAMATVVNNARRLAGFGAAVILIHHDTKSRSDSPRGHSLFNGALDVSVHVSKETADVVSGKLRKNRNGSCDLSIDFKIETHELGVDDDGDPVVVALAVECLRAEQHQGKLPKSQATALDILRRITGLSHVAAEQDWKAACVAEGGISRSPDHDNRRRVFDNAKSELQRAGAITVTNGMVRLNWGLNAAQVFTASGFGIPSENPDFSVARQAHGADGFGHLP